MEIARLNYMVDVAGLHLPPSARFSKNRVPLIPKQLDRVALASFQASTGFQNSKG